MNKLCCTCKQEKPVEEFGKLTASKDGLAIRCKECFRRLSKESAQRNPEARKASKRKHYESHKEEWVVDHIVPISRKDVCGLHVEQNLRVIPEKANYAKSNKMLPNVMEVMSCHF